MASTITWAPAAETRAGTVDHDGRPPRGRWRRWRRIASEVVLLAAAGLAYSLVRGLTDDRVNVAFANADRVIDLERRLGIFVEEQWQGAIVDTPIVHVANAVYVLYWPVIAGVLAWLLVRHPRRYRLYRNAVLASGAVTLAIFATYPLAPPRFLPEYGFTDTIAAYSGNYREFNASALVNEYAAMPSLHLGWILLVTIAVLGIVRSRPARLAVATLPVAMFAAIVLTGNHFIVDGVVGVAVVLVGLLIASLADRAPPISVFRPAPSPAVRAALRSGRRHAARSWHDRRR